MKTNWLFFLILVIFTGHSQSQQDACFPWLNRSRMRCSCYYTTTKIKCTSDFPLLPCGNCMTYNSTSKTIEYGICPYIAHYNNITIVDEVFGIQLPSNVSLLNEFMCGPLNREGALCGKCKDGYGTALYSYTLECSKCWVHGYGWALYYFLELFPITVMYFLVVIFHIRATSSPLSALVFMSQIVVYTIRLNIRLHMYIENELTGFSYVALQVLLILCSIWSLDFFRSVIPSFCVSSNIKTIHALALEYLVAFYPICLIIITYVFIKLHDNDFMPVVWLWKPFHRHFVHFRRRWDSKASIVNAFTTFLLLSFSKVLFVSFTLLYYFNVHNNNHLPQKCVLYYDPTVECHTQEFAIFGTIAVCILIIFIIFPTVLLILYPTRLFRRCVSCCGFRRWHALHMFVESFQGQYKDGTNGTCDFRMLSASFLLLRILVLVLFLNRYRLPSHTSELQGALFACTTCFYAITRPYKLNFMNNIDVVILFLLEILILSTSYPGSRLLTHLILGSTLLLLIPHIVLIFYICHKLAKKAGITQCLKRNYTILKRCMQATINQNLPDLETESDIDFLPDRLINPEEYEPVQPTTGEHAAAKPTEDEEPVNEDPRKMTPVYTYGSFS